MLVKAKKSFNYYIPEFQNVFTQKTLASCSSHPKREEQQKQQSS